MIDIEKMKHEGGREMMIPLEKADTPTLNRIHWKACLPFVENKRAALIHRPRTGTTYNIHRYPHIGISFWCGASTTGDSKKFDFLNQPPEGRILCEKCEINAVKSGLPSAEELVGKHVCVGGVIAVKTCCKEQSP